METLKALYRIRSHDIAYLKATIESYDNMAVVRTVDPRAALIELQVSPGCENVIHEILTYLAIHENIQLVRIDDHSDPDQPQDPC